MNEENTTNNIETIPSCWRTKYRWCNTLLPNQIPQNGVCFLFSFHPPHPNCRLQYDDDLVKKRAIKNPLMIGVKLAQRSIVHLKFHSFMSWKNLRLALESLQCVVDAWRCAINIEWVSFDKNETIRYYTFTTFQPIHYKVLTAPEVKSDGLR